MNQSTATKTQIRPLGNRVLIKRSEAKSTKGSIILPDSAQEKPQEGTAIAVGPGVRDEKGALTPTSITTGQKVLFSSYAGSEVKDIDGQEFLIISENDILAIIQN
jgi:chaperonin GroES